jgi:hypothetical protein
MSIKTDAVVIRDETVTGANTATRVGTNLVDIADDLVAKQAAIDAKVSFDSASSTRLANTSGTNTGDQILTGLDYEPTKGVDDNYVTDAEKVIIGNTSGANTGDNAVNSLYSGLDGSKQDNLVSGTNIKTINGTSVLGSGDLVVAGGGGTWGSITGTLSDQTDLQAALDGIVAGSGASASKEIKSDWNGSIDTWTVTVAPDTGHQLFANNVYLVEGVGNDYQVAGNVITYTTAPLASEVHTYFPNVVVPVDLATHTHVKADITDFSDADYATTAQGAKADSALQSYTETDPIYSAWDKSTGISITASQVSDFDTEVSNNANVVANANTIDSIATETGANQVLNVVSITQAAYDLLTPISTTLYVING